MATVRILCVCKGNTCRSPMLAAVLRRELQLPNVVIESAGILAEAAGQHAAPEWTTLKDVTGISLSTHRSRFIGHIGDLGRFTVVICAEPAVIGPVVQQGVLPEKILLANAPDGIPNPWRHPDGVEAYRNCYLAVMSAVSRLIPQLPLVA